jgi:hypothetical protein
MITGALSGRCQPKQCLFVGVALQNDVEIMNRQ